MLSFDSWRVHYCCCTQIVACAVLSRKPRAVLLQRAGAAVHNHSSEHFSVIGRTKYSAALAQQYNCNATPA